MVTKVIAINGSPRMEKGNTAKILTPFLNGMKEAGATIELIYARKLNIKSCIGDFQCWFEKVGECVHSDDMQHLFSKLRKADILILATPVYIPLPGEMQNLINRLCPIVEPILEFREGRTRARFHQDVNISKIILVSSCGWWEMGNFGTVLRIAEELALDVGVEFAGAVLRPHASEMTENQEKAKEVIEAAHRAGFQMIKDGKMSEEILAVISQPLISEEDFRHQSNRSYEKAKQS